MQIVSKYFIRLVAVNTLVVTLTLTGVIWLTQSLKFIDLIVNRGLSVQIFFHLVILLVPRFLVVTLPIGLLISVISAYHKLHSDSELVVLRSAGLKKMDLARPAIYFAFFVMFLSYLLNLYILPSSYSGFKDLQHNIRNDYGTLLLQEGVFNTLHDDLMVYVSERDGAGTLYGLLIHDNRKKDKPVSIIAEKGTIAPTKKGPGVVMVRGNRQELDRKTGQLNLLFFDRYVLHLSMFNKEFKPRWKSAKERFLPELFWPGNTKDDLDNADKLRVEAHRRLVSPLYNLAFVSVSLAVLLSAGFSRSRNPRAVFIASFLCVFIQLVGLGLENLAVKNVALVPLMYLNVLGAIAGGYFLLKGNYDFSLWFVKKGKKKNA